MSDSDNLQAKRTRRGGIQAAMSSIGDFRGALGQTRTSHAVRPNARSRHRRDDPRGDVAPSFSSRSIHLLK